MKKLLLFSITLFIAISFLSCGDSGKDESDNLDKGSTSDFQKRYGIKSGVIEYIITGSQEGTKTLYFDSWGMRQAEYTRSVLSVGGFTKSLNLAHHIHQLPPICSNTCLSDFFASFTASEIFSFALSSGLYKLNVFISCEKQNIAERKKPITKTILFISFIVYQ